MEDGMALRVLKKTSNVKRVRALLLIVPDRDHPDQEFKKQANSYFREMWQVQLEADRENLEAQVSRIQMSIDIHPAFEFPPAYRCDIKFIAAKKLGPVPDVAYRCPG